MRHLILGLLIGATLLFYSCGDDTQEAESVVYTLDAYSEMNATGTLTVTREADNKARFNISLGNTIQGFMYPTHLHFGDLTVENAAVAYQLNPIVGSSGTSETVVSVLSNDVQPTFDDIVNGNFSVKIHLGDSEEDKKVILAACNLDATVTESAGRVDIAVCGSSQLLSTPLKDHAQEPSGE